MVFSSSPSGSKRRRISVDSASTSTAATTGSTSFTPSGSLASPSTTRTSPSPSTSPRGTAYSIRIPAHKGVSKRIYVNADSPPPIGNVIPPPPLYHPDVQPLYLETRLPPPAAEGTYHIPISEMPADCAPRSNNLECMRHRTAWLKGRQSWIEARGYTGRLKVTGFRLLHHALLVDWKTFKFAVYPDTLQPQLTPEPLPTAFLFGVSPKRSKPPEQQHDISTADHMQGVTGASSGSRESSSSSTSQGTSRRLTRSMARNNQSTPPISRPPLWPPGSPLVSMWDVQIPAGATLHSLQKMVDEGQGFVSTPAAAGSSAWRPELYQRRPPPVAHEVIDVDAEEDEEEAVEELINHPSSSPSRPPATYLVSAVQQAASRVSISDAQQEEEEEEEEEEELAEERSPELVRGREEEQTQDQPPPPECSNCHVTSSLRWRASILDPSQQVCYRCGNYEKVNKRARPLVDDMVVVVEEEERQAEVERQAEEAEEERSPESGRGREREQTQGQSQTPECSNCHVTSSLSWRASILHPSQQVCYRCGNYEKVNKRARPLVEDMEEPLSMCVPLPRSVLLDGVGGKTDSRGRAHERGVTSDSDAIAERGPMSGRDSATEHDVVHEHEEPPNYGPDVLMAEATDEDRRLTELDQATTFLETYIDYYDNRKPLHTAYSCSATYSARIVPPPSQVIAHSAESPQERLQIGLTHSDGDDGHGVARAVEELRMAHKLTFSDVDYFAAMCDMRMPESVDTTEDLCMMLACVLKDADWECDMAFVLRSKEWDERDRIRTTMSPLVVVSHQVTLYQGIRHL